ncbi:adenylate/guanylate cyclase domain-containing protein [Sphingomicrobium aestuariivivum]|uniref:adenylate/guanylate cyclase domain-containing protein n=1 Tax=Sphingomicrobium aestuariivivum TaxID=1582356 RepID=UPI001FD680B3|nr:adenylate/guanylate cyclase domain-containing protein [Sphingomicrobium aestuariivivum]MCJ8192044.1 AAA family ATPase [Sphingomicrobium aestuariivivum]
MPSLPGSGADFERRRISVLFADLVGSTDLMEALGADDYAATLRGFHSLCTTAVRSRGGTVAQYQGDGVMCFFGYPTAEEDDASRAVSAALEILASLDASNEGGDHPLATRIGIASGTAIIARGSDQFGGETVGACVNLASRLQDLAETGSVVICEDTLDLVGGSFKTRALGARKVKGFAEPKPVYEVNRAASADVTRFHARRDRFDGPLIGRQQTLETLLEGIRDARAGHGSSISLCGPPGIGKSRIFQALGDHEDVAGVPSFVLQCAPEYSSVALHPVTAYLDWVTGVRPSDSDEVRRRKLTRLFQAVWNADEKETTALLDLVAPTAPEGPPEGDDSATLKRQRSFDILIDRMFGSVGSDKAFTLVFEDVHWIDPTTLEFMARVAARVDEFPILLVATTRPEGEPAIEQCGFKQELRLEPLSAEHAGELARAVAAAHGLSPERIDEVVEMAEGVPLFLEEYAKLTSKHRDSGLQHRVPLSLSGIVLSKLDRLDEEQRNFAKAGSVLGRTFLAMTAAMMCNVAPAHAEQVQDELSHQQILEIDAADQCSFSHALIRDGIYDTLDADRRRALHLRAAHLLSEQGGREIPASVVAGHYASGGDARAAADWYLRAARQNASLGAVPEAATNLDNALEQVERLPEGEERDRLELSIRAVQGPVLMVMRGPGNPAFGEAQERARALLEKLGIDDMREQVIFHTALHNWARGDFDEALERVDLLDEMAEQRAEADQGLDFARLTMRGLIGWHAGRTRETETLLDETARRYDPAVHKPLYARYLMEFGIFGRFYLSLAKSVLGKEAEAKALAEDAATFARELKFPHATGFSQLARFVGSMLRDDVEACAEQAAVAHDFSTAQGFPEFVAMATFAKGWSYSRQGDSDRGIEMMQGGLAHWDKTGFKTWQPIFSAILARALVDTDRLDEAEAVIAEADSAILLSGEEQARAPLLLARAMLAAKRGDEALSLNIARRAVGACRHEGACLWADRVKQEFPELQKGVS